MKMNLVQMPEIFERVEQYSRVKSEARAMIQVYKHGLDGTVPHCWKDIARQVAKDLDPEYIEYTRLEWRFHSDPAYRRMLTLRDKFGPEK